MYTVKFLTQFFEVLNESTTTQILTFVLTPLPECQRQLRQSLKGPKGPKLRQSYILQ